MYDFIGMDIPDSLKQSFEDVEDYERIGKFLFLPQTHEISSFEVLHDKDEAGFFLEEFLKAIDVWTFDDAENSSFLEDKIFGGCFILIFFVNNLSCVYFACLLLFNFHHLSQCHRYHREAAFAY